MAPTIRTTGDAVNPVLIIIFQKWFAIITFFFFFFFFGSGEAIDRSIGYTGISSLIGQGCERHMTQLWIFIHNWAERDPFTLYFRKWADL